MIVRDRPNGVRLFLTMRGSVLPSIWKSVAITTLLAVIVTLTHGQLWDHKIKLTIIPFTLMGLPLAIFLGFRNNCYQKRAQKCAASSSCPEPSSRPCSCLAGVTSPPAAGTIPAAVPGITAWLAKGSAVVAARAPVASRCRLIAALTSRS